MTHYLPVFTRENGPFRETVCGEWIRLTEHSRTPTCPRCSAWLLEDAQRSEDEEEHQGQYLHVLCPDTPTTASDAPIPPDRCPAALGRRHDFSMRGSDGTRRCWHCCQTKAQVAAKAKPELDDEVTGHAI